jgi:hypothetical protein
MWRSRRNPIVLSLALVLLLLAVVAPGASAAGDEPVVIGPLPAVPILKEPAAQGAAWTQVRAFRNHSPLVRVVSFHGCERDGLRAFTCNFTGRGSLQPGASACRMTVTVSGLASNLKSKLHSGCRANPAHFLTVKRGRAAIKAAVEELYETEADVGALKRFGSAELLATVAWRPASGNCEARFIVRLAEDSDELRVTHTAPSCN